MLDGSRRSGLNHLVESTVRIRYGAPPVEPGKHRCWSEVLADGPRLGIIATGHGGTRNVSRVVLGGVHRAIAYGLDITSSPQTYG